MRNKALVRVVQVLGFISSLALLPAAQAVQKITMTLPDCPSGQALTFDPADNTLNCGISGPPVSTPGSCSIAANPTSQLGSGLAPNTPVQLTASCASVTRRLRIAGISVSSARSRPSRRASPQPIP